MSKYQKTITLNNSDLLELEWGHNFSNMTIKKDGVGTKSDAPEPVRKQFSDPNAPLDSDL